MPNISASMCCFPAKILEISSLFYYYSLEKGGELAENIDFFFCQVYSQQAFLPSVMQCDFLN